ncbi:MAG: FkbM family methyltransferase [Pseudomonadota bacterium]
MAKESYYIEMMGKAWQDYVKPVKLDVLTRRIDITAACRDCDPVPRVDDAGECRVDDSGYAVQIMHNGLKVLYGRYYGNWVNEIIKRLNGVHEPQEEWVFHSILPHVASGSAMIELGCYWGYYSMWFAKAVPEARNFLVEPHPRQMQTARTNFEINGLSADFTIGYVGSYPEQKKKIQEQRVGELPRFTIPEFMDLKGLDRIGLLHSDIQGHEEEMLDGAREVLAQRRIDWLFISTHGRRHPACREILTDAGYRLLAEHGVGGSASADGLLVAQNPDLPEIPPIEISEVEGLVTAHG